MKLFIDDLREPPDASWHLVKSSSEAIDFVRHSGIPLEISFDHDLGGEDTSRIFIGWLIEYLLDNNLLMPSGFKFTVHSMNPIGRLWITSTMNRIISAFRAEG